MISYDSWSWELLMSPERSDSSYGSQELPGALKSPRIALYLPIFPCEPRLNRPAERPGHEPGRSPERSDSSDGSQELPGALKSPRIALYLPMSLA